MKYLSVFVLLVTLIGCERSVTESVTVPAQSASVASEVAMTVYKSPTCGCCGDWVKHIEEQNFTAKIAHPENLDAVKDQLGIKPEYRSCHTGVTQEGYVFEGHIPAKTINEFLQQPPQDALGLAVPGMPLGSPGMEVEDRFTPYSVLLLKRDGSTEVYRHFASAAEQH